MVAKKGTELNVKFIPEVHLSFKNFALEMVGYTSSSVSILVSWYICCIFLLLFLFS